MIRQRLPLPPGCARCPDTRTQPCARATECARGVEPHAKGREVNDFSIEPRSPGAPCGWFMEIRYADPAQPKARTHDAPGWL